MKADNWFSTEETSDEIQSDMKRQMETYPDYQLMKSHVKKCQIMRMRLKF